MFRRLLFVLFVVVFCYHFVVEGVALYKHTCQAVAEAKAKAKAKPQAQPAPLAKQP